MIADPCFNSHLSAWCALDKMLRSQFMNKPFLIDTKDPTYFALFERFRNSFSLSSDSHVLPPSGSLPNWPSSCSCPISDSSSSSNICFTPYDKEHSCGGNSFPDPHRLPLCLYCGTNGHCALTCFASQANHPECSLLVKWRNNRLVNKSNKPVCIIFNVKGSCSDSSTSTHGEHSCSLCRDQHHAATACPRN